MNLKHVHICIRFNKLKFCSNGFKLPDVSAAWSIVKLVAAGRFDIKSRFWWDSLPVWIGKPICSKTRARFLLIFIVRMDFNFTKSTGCTLNWYDDDTCVWKSSLSCKSSVVRLGGGPETIQIKKKVYIEYLKKLSTSYNIQIYMNVLSLRYKRSFIFHKN